MAPLQRVFSRNTFSSVSQLGSGTDEQFFEVQLHQVFEVGL
jgi:hypothetical protein